MYVKRSRRAAVLAVTGLVAALGAPVTPASAAPGFVHTLNWAQISNNAAGVVFHPKGDLFDVWDNQPGDSEYTVVYYNYKGIKDRWKEAAVVKDGVKSTRVRKNLVEHKRIYFYVALWRHDPAGQAEITLSSDVSQYPTT